MSNGFGARVGWGASPNSQKLFWHLMLRVQESHFVDFLHSSGFFIVLFLLGAWGSFWGPP